MGNTTSVNLPKLEQIIEAQTKELICIYDPSGNYLYVSPSSIHVLGYTPDETKSLQVEDLLHDEDIYNGEKRTDFFNKNLNEHFELRFLRKDHKWIWLQFLIQFIPYGEDSVYYLTATDVTKSKKIKEELERYKRLFDETNHLTKIGAWEVDLESNESLVTDKVYQIFDIEAAKDESQSNLVDLVLENEQGLVKSAYDHILEKGGEYDFEAPILTENTRKWVRTIGRSILRENKKPILVGAFQDITESKEKEEKIKDQNRDLKDLSTSLSRQNRQLLEFSYIISHNLRGPVGNLVTLANFLKESEDEEELEMVIEHIYESTSNLNQTFEELVDVLKVRDKNNLDITKVDIPLAIEKNLKLYESDLVELNTSVNIDFKAFQKIDFSKVYFDSIITNFISNAIKYRDPEKQRLILHIKSEINELGEMSLRFEDNGLGIDLNRFGKKVFKLHKTFHRHSEGRGVGLFMSKNQMEVLGGDLRVKSEVGKGSCFYMIFNPIIREVKVLQEEY